MQCKEPLSIKSDGTVTASHLQEDGRNRTRKFYLSFPRSAWERKCATLCVAACLFAGRDAERPDMRFHAERGNEKTRISLAADKPNR